jgi:transcriptional regulator of arginine metabolism
MYPSLLVLARPNVNGNAGRVQTEHHFGKADRQKLVASLVQRKRIGTQQELLVALRGVGCVVTQATVSRDIRELGLEKARDALGSLRYVLPNTERRVDPRETLKTLLAQFGRRAVAAQNVVVLQSEIGSAPAIARALDRCAHPLVLGTLAGDDTCLAIAANAHDALELAAELNAAIG